MHSGRYKKERERKTGVEIYKECQKSVREGNRKEEEKEIKEKFTDENVYETNVSSKIFKNCNCEKEHKGIFSGEL